MADRKIDFQQEGRAIYVEEVPADEATVSVANHRLVDEVKETQINEVNDRHLSEDGTQPTTPVNNIDNRN